MELRQHKQTKPESLGLRFLHVLKELRLITNVHELQLLYAKRVTIKKAPSLVLSVTVCDTATLITHSRIGSLISSWKLVHNARKPPDFNLFINSAASVPM